MVMLAGVWQARSVLSRHPRCKMVVPRSDRDRAGLTPDVLIRSHQIRWIPKWITCRLSVADHWVTVWPTARRYSRLSTSDLHRHDTPSHHNWFQQPPPLHPRAAPIPTRPSHKRKPTKLVLFTGRWINYLIRPSRSHADEIRIKFGFISRQKMVSVCEGTSVCLFKDFSANSTKIYSISVPVNGKRMVRNCSIPANDG